MATLTKTKDGPSVRRKAGISAIAGMLIGLGITAAAAPAVYFAFQENFSQFTEFAALDVQNLNAVRDGDRLVVTGTIKNVGSTSISSIILEELSVDDLRIRQDGALADGEPKALEYGRVTLTGNLFGGGSCTDNNLKALTGLSKYNGTSAQCANASVDISGLTTIDSGNVMDIVRIDGDGSTVLRIEIEGGGAGNFDVTQSVDLTEELTIVLRFLSGESEEITEVYRTSVKRG